MTHDHTREIRRSQTPEGQAKAELQRNATRQPVLISMRTDLYEALRIIAREQGRTTSEVVETIICGVAKAALAALEGR